MRIFFPKHRKGNIKMLIKDFWAELKFQLKPEQLALMAEIEPKLFDWALGEYKNYETKIRNVERMIVVKAKNADNPKDIKALANEVLRAQAKKAEYYFWMVATGGKEKTEKAIK